MDPKHSNIGTVLSVLTHSSCCKLTDSRKEKEFTCLCSLAFSSILFCNSSLNIPGDTGGLL